MSQYLDSLLGAQQRAECAKNDAALQGAEPNQPVIEPQHTDDWHRRNDARALELQMVDFRARGVDVIGRLIAWLRQRRIRHHHARVHMFGTAVLAAQITRDWPAADEFHRYMQAERAKRDALIAKQRQSAWGVRHLPNGDFEVVR